MASGSGLLLPRAVVEERRAKEAVKPPIPRRVVPAKMAPGWLRFNKIDVGEYVGPSGLVEIRKDKFSRTKYGRVIACGKYQDRTGKIHDAVDQWPLPLNTVVEIRNHDPWENHDGTLTVPTYDVVGYWLPGTEPDFLKE